MQLEWKQTFLVETFPRYESYHSIKHIGDQPLFYDNSLALRFAESFSLELEAMAARSRKQSGCIDHLKATGRFMMMNDIIGDLFSLILGGSFIQSFVPSLHDPSSFHHGRSECECFISIGKEAASGTEWVQRGWAFGGIGFAERGVPWVRGEVAYEFKTGEQFQWRLFMTGLKGMGQKSLRLHDFNGYGSINHASADLGLRLLYEIPFFGNVSLEYARRIYARNFPCRVNQFLIRLFYLNGL